MIFASWKKRISWRTEAGDLVVAVVRRNINKTEGEGALRPRVRIGVLGLQGDFLKHCEMLAQIEYIEPRVVRMPQEIEQCDGLIIPGGESTTVGKLMARYGVDKAIKSRVARGMPVFGTCMGMILLAKEIEDSDQYSLGLMDTTVRRNAFGRQVDSFEADLKITSIGDPAIRAVFIRAPFITEVRNGAEVLAALDTGEIVMVRQDNCLAAAFHPELTNDTRVHEYFVNMAITALAASRN